MTAGESLQDYLAKLARHRDQHRKIPKDKIPAIRIALIHLITQRMEELNGKWDISRDYRVLWALDYCRFSDDMFNIPPQHEAIAFSFLLNKNFTGGRGSPVDEL